MKPLLFLIALLAHHASGAEVIETDIAIYGGTSGGVVAAVQAARMGKKAVVIEPSRHLGGMMSGGLGWIDVNDRRFVGGLAEEFFAVITRRYAADGIHLAMFGNEGCTVEPRIAEEVLRDWAKKSGARLIYEHRLAGVTKQGARIRAITLDHAPPDGRGAPAATAKTAGAIEVRAAMWIDASYEGDLMARAGVSHRIDREGRAETGEKFAGVVLPQAGKGIYGGQLAVDPYVRPGEPASGLLPLISDAPLPTEGSPSRAMQAYNFRLCLTDRNPLPIAPPAGYDPARFEVVARYIVALEKAGDPLTEGDLIWGRHMGAHPRLLKITPIARGKSDTNNAGPFSTDYVGGGSERYAEASWAERAAIWHAHEDYMRGLLHFLQTDPRVPPAVRTELNRWGLARDEFTDTAGWPHALYIRECRRMLGRHVMHERDCVSPRAIEDSVGLGSYPLDSHLVQRFAHEGRVVNEGGFLQPFPDPYPIPYRAITPRAEECENLLVTFCVSATHVAFDSLRMEPVFMVLSQSAATAANHALDAGTSVQAIDPEQLRARLVADKQVLEKPRAAR